MWQANPTWGSPRIVAELDTLGIEVAKSTVQKYRPRGQRLLCATWQTFFDQHVKKLVAIDFFIVPTVKFTVPFVFRLRVHERRRIVHFKVTEHPAAQWTAQKIVEAVLLDTAPRYRLRDGDRIYLVANAPPLDQDAPDGRPVQSAGSGKVIEFPVVHALHHYHLPKAA